MDHVLRATHLAFRLLPDPHQMVGHDHYSHFADGDTEAQRRKVAHPRSPANEWQSQDCHLDPLHWSNPTNVGQELTAGTSLPQWLGFHASMAGAIGSTPGQGTKVPRSHMPCSPGKKKKKHKKHCEWVKFCWRCVGNLTAFM